MNFRSAAGFFLLSLAIAASLTAQNSRFGYVPGKRSTGGEVKWSIPEGGKVEGVKDEFVILSGGVTVEYQDVKLQATRVTLNLKTKDVTAEGNVIIDQGPTRVTASRAVYNLNTKTGTFFTATAATTPELHFAGDRIEKIDVDTYKLTNGVFTSCNLDEPAWSFRIGEATVTLDDYAYMHDVSFRAGPVPILWTPRLTWPTKRDRSRGFLIPRLRVGGEFGERLQMGYFIPFGDSADATLTADLMTEGHLGAGLNVRYLPSQNVKIGELDLDGVQLDHAVPIQGQDIESFQWRYHYRHAQENLPGGFRGVIDIQDFSNLDFFRQYEDDSRLLTLSNVYSSAYLTKNRPRYSLNILTDRRELLFFDQTQHFEQLPALQFRMYPQRVAGPLYFSLESSAAQLRTNSIGNQTHSYFRTDFFPTLSLQLRTPAWFSIKPQISARQTNYGKSLDVDLITGAPVVSEDPVDRFYAQGQVEVVGPSFSRVFNTSIGGFTRFKHVIEPRFRYLYTSDVQNQRDIIRFDTVDSPYLPIVRDSVEYALVQRILGKETATTAAREILSLTLRQTAALSRPFERAGGSTGFTESNTYTPLFATLRVNPFQTVTVDASAQFGNLSHQVDQTSFSANILGTGANTGRYVGVTWFATYEDPAHNRTSSSSAWRVSTGSPLLKDRFRLDMDLNYDAKQHQFIEQRFVVGTTGSCWGVSIGARRFVTYEPDPELSDWNYIFNVSLKNVGSFGSLK